MSFRCQLTGRHCEGKPRRVITHTKEVIHPPVYKEVNGRMIQIAGGGRGRQIVREILVDPKIPISQLPKTVHEPLTFNVADKVSE